MEHENLFDLLFEIKDEKCIFNIDDKVLGEIYNQLEITENKLKRFINKRVHPKSRAMLSALLKDTDKIRSKQQYRENQLYYKNGVIDGVNLVFLLSSFK